MKFEDTIDTKAFDYSEENSANVLPFDKYPIFLQENILQYTKCQLIQFSRDDDGRLSRILTTLMLLQQGYAYVPYCSLESIVEENKDRYHLALRRAQESFKTDHGSLNEWLAFFLSTIVRQKEILDTKVADEVSLSMAGLPAESVRILEIVNDRGKTTIADIIHLTGAKRNTAKTRLKDLVARGFLVRHGVGKGSWYARGEHPEG